ncbi:hypothetical protein HaLaN_20565 [Haematococcus lacustris]|uniref:Uncharacterized protein n=1 Tax=Haematococcus lacustris TaxID=44745 RepID=A0A699ZJS2_HAELA|nr:hypothetical protein HaLaN_20565 [Haematococcus lacustris]
MNSETSGRSIPAETPMSQPPVTSTPNVEVGGQRRSDTSTSAPVPPQARKKGAARAWFPIVPLHTGPECSRNPHDHHIRQYHKPFTQAQFFIVVEGSSSSNCSGVVESLCQEAGGGSVFGAALEALQAPGHVGGELIASCSRALCRFTHCRVGAMFALAWVAGGMTGMDHMMIA